MSLRETLHQTAALLSELADGPIAEEVDAAIALIAGALRDDRVLLVCGNGGSMADAQHIAGELGARFLKERRGLKAIALGTNQTLLTAWSNDYDYISAYAREVEAVGEPGGALLAISTSGNSPNILKAAEAARAKGMSVVALTGEGGGRLGPLADRLLAVPSRATPRIQEAHIVLYHYICQAVEDACS